MDKSYYIIESSDSETFFVSKELLTPSQLDDGKEYLSPHFTNDIREACSLTKIEANRLLKQIKSELIKAFNSDDSNCYQIIKIIK